jgi:predicted nucleic acid-binding protein
MRVLLDTNVILDFLLDREPFSEAAAAVWQASEDGLIEAYVSAITPVNVYYITRRLHDVAKAHYVVAGLLTACQVCPRDATILQQALELPFRDYEDAVQHASASASGLDAIVTRDVAGYSAATLPVLSPADLLDQLGATGN